MRVLVFTFWLVVALWLLGFGAQGQSKTWHMPDSLFFLSNFEVSGGPFVAEYPFAGEVRLFEEPYQPYVQVATANTLWQKRRQQLQVAATFGFGLQRLASSSFPLRAEVRYLLQWARYSFVEGSVGFGYLQTLPSTKVPKTKGQTADLVKDYLTPKVSPQLAIGLRQGFGPAGRGQLLLRYQAWLQMPVLVTFKPILPFHAVMIGYSYNFRKRK